MILRILLFLSLGLFLVAKPLKVASWNVENLFDMQRQGTEYDEYIPGKHGWNAAVLQKKLNHLSEVICDLDVDILALQEVENDTVLAMLQQRLKRVGCPYPYRYITRDKKTPVHVAILSRLPLRQRRDVRIAPSGRYRSILEAVLSGDPPLHLFVNHWRSKAGPESERILYAKALRRRIERLPAGSEYLLLGDFNSDYQEYRIIDRCHNDRHGITGINQVLGTVRKGRLVRRDDLQGVQKGLLHYNLWLELPASKRWSHNFYGDKEAIDAILIPPTLLDGKGWEYRIGSFGVYRPRYLLGRHGEVRRWEYRHGRHSGKGYSDHLPIYAVFENLNRSEKESWWQRTMQWAGISKKKGEKPSKETSKKKGIEETTIEALNRMESLKQPLLLRQVTVLFKRGRNAVIQRGPGGEALLIYGAAAPLEEGGIYDLEVHGLKRYEGMPELTDIEIAGHKGQREIAPFLIPPNGKVPEGREAVSRIVRDLNVTYRNGMVRWGGKSYRLYFRKRRWKPPDGSRLMIKRAQIGYYKNHKELVVWDRHDFEIQK